MKQCYLPEGALDSIDTSLGSKHLRGLHEVKGAAANRGTRGRQGVIDNICSSRVVEDDSKGVPRAVS